MWFVSLLLIVAYQKSTTAAAKSSEITQLEESVAAAAEEVARIEMQARALHGQSHLSIAQVLTAVHAEHGVRGLFQGLLPRMGTNVWLTLFMISGANIVRELREGSEQKAIKAKQLARRSMSGTVLVGSRLHGGGTHVQ